jgi:sodium-independent sulfate anion transporter 11
MPKFIQRWKHALQTDPNWHRLGSLASRGGRALPRATAEYILEKFPIIGWLPKYDYRWLPNDIIAGLTLGLMLVPQSLAYADIATIPVQYGLMSSWFPALLYAFMGTTKGES